MPTAKRKPPKRQAAAPVVQPKRRDHVAIAAAWEQSVLDGTFPCGKRVRLAVKRQRRDLERVGSDGFPYIFDAELGARAVRFLELLPHVEGPKADQLIVLEPWQVWAVVVLFGWRTRDGQPRFRRGTFFMPKGQGKTFLGAGMALYVLANGGKGEKVYSAATAKDQARLSFETGRQMLNRAPQLRDRCGLVVGQHAITQPSTGGLFQPVSSEARSLEGKIPSYILEDEIHAHPTREVHDNLRSSAAKRPDSRMVIISTAGFDTSEQSIGYEVYSYAKQILEGEVEDDSQFALLIEADETDDPWAPETWRKANPNLGVSIDALEVANEANEARQIPAKRKSFFTKRLGWWVSGRSAYFDVETWDTCANAVPAGPARALPCYLGLDLASRRAFASLARVFVQHLPHRDPARAAAGETERHYHAYVDSFLHEEAVNASDTFKAWAKSGHIIATPGHTTDYGFILKRVRAYLSAHRVVEIVSDPYEAAQLTQQLGEIDIPFVEYPQQVKYLSPAMQELHAAHVSGRLHHDGNKALRWMAGNVTAKLDANDNVFPRKEREDLYIDGISATLNAIGRAISSQPEGGSYLDHSDIVVLG
jgi:phage terminase large subunit-like protein